MEDVSVWSDTPVEIPWSNQLRVVCCRTGHWWHLQSIREPGSDSETSLPGQPRWGWTFDLVSDNERNPERKTLGEERSGHLAFIKNHCVASLVFWPLMIKINAIWCCFVHSDYTWYYITTTLTHTVYMLETCGCLTSSTWHRFDKVDTEESPLSNCWFLQSERWQLTAVTCSQRIWSKVDSDWRGKRPLSRSSLLGLLVLCTMCCIMWTPQWKNTHQRPDTLRWAAAQTCTERFGGCATVCLMYVCPLGFSALSFLM